jgi:hypothetical protein
MSKSPPTIIIEGELRTYLAQAARESGRGVARAIARQRIAYDLRDDNGRIGLSSLHGDLTRQP